MNRYKKYNAYYNSMSTVMSDNNYSRRKYRLMQYGFETIAIVYDSA